MVAKELNTSSSRWLFTKEMQKKDTTLVYTRPDYMVENETITIPDDGKEDEPLETGETRIKHSGPVAVTTGDSTLEKQGTREPAPSNPPEIGDHSLYRELLERARQDPATQERDLEEAMTGTPNKKRQLQEDVKQVQEMRAFQDYLHEHGLREGEVDAFGNCLFLSIARHMTEQEAMYSTATPEDPKSLHSNTARSIRNLALDHMLEHRSAFEGSFGSKSNKRTTTDRITADTEIDTVMEEELEAERERDALDSALDPDLDHYCKRMRSETAQGDELTIRAAAWALRINIRVLKMNSTTATIMALTYPGTPPDLEEGSGTSNSLGSDDQGLRTITIAHYVCQHGGAGHYNPIIHQDKEDYSLEETDIFEVVDDEESPNPESNAHWKDDEEAIPIVTSPTMDTEEPESPDQRHSSWATARAAAAAEKKAGLQQFQTDLRQKLTPKVWISAGALDQ